MMSEEVEKEVTSVEVTTAEEIEEEPLVEAPSPEGPSPEGDDDGEDQGEETIALEDDGRSWYVVHCYSGYEKKVRHSIEQRIETMDMQDKIFDVVVPTEEEIEIKDGKRRTVERRVFPGYILVQLIMDEDSWYVVRNTPGVTGFVGMGNEPTPLRPDEVAKIMNRMEAEAPTVKFNFQPGEKVRVRSGPFSDFIGTVDEIDLDRAKVKVLVSFFGRETPVELDFLHIENI
jgi:transcriptional antiterminator NusG